MVHLLRALDALAQVLMYVPSKHIRGLELPGPIVPDTLKFSKHLLTCATLKKKAGIHTNTYA